MTEQLTILELLVDSAITRAADVVAMLATRNGQRAGLAFIGARFEQALVDSLRRRDVGQKVIAEMLGIPYSTYLKQQRRRPINTPISRTLWREVVGHLQQQQQSSFTRLLHRFRHRNEITLRGVIHDLRSTGLVKIKRNSTTHGDVEIRWNDNKSNDLSAESKLGLLAWAILQADWPQTACEMRQLTQDHLPNAAESLLQMVEKQHVNEELGREIATYLSYYQHLLNQRPEAIRALCTSLTRNLDQTMSGMLNDLRHWLKSLQHDSDLLELDEDLEQLATNLHNYLHHCPNSALDSLQTA